MLRENRQQLPKEIHAIFGVNSQKPLIVLEWDDVKIQMHIDTALHHATCLLEASSSAQTDSFLYQFLSSNFQLEVEQIEGLIKEFSLHRARLRLETIIGV